MDNFNPKEEAKGLGDSIAKVTHFFRLDKVADAVARLVGAEGCGCAERREYLNQLFPYKKTVRQFMVLRDIKRETDVNEYLEGTIVDISRAHELFGSVIELVKDKFLVEVE
jgi:hypothetical protein